MLVLVAVVAMLVVGSSLYARLASCLACSRRLEMVFLSLLFFSIFPTPVFKNPKFRRLEFLEDCLDLESRSFLDCSTSREKEDDLDREEEAFRGEFNEMLLPPPEEDLNPNRGILC